MPVTRVSDFDDDGSAFNLALLDDDNNDYDGSLNLDDLESDRHQDAQTDRDNLEGYSHGELEAIGEDFAISFITETLEQEDIRIWRKAAVLAQRPRRFLHLDGLSNAEALALKREITHPQEQPRAFQRVLQCYTAVMGLSLGLSCFLHAWTTVNSCVQDFSTFHYLELLGQIPSLPQNSCWQKIFLGIAATPYIVAAGLGCWFAIPVNHTYGQRKTVLLSAVLMVLAYFIQLIGTGWQAMLVGRVLFGIGLGPILVTIPLYCAEVSPPRIRGFFVTTFCVAWIAGQLTSLFPSIFVTMIWPKAWRVVPLGLGMASVW